MKTNPEKTYKVLLEQMTPVYTFVTVTAMNDEEAAAKAEDMASEEGHEWSHDRLPSDGVWSIIPPVDILMPAQDGPVKVLGVCDGLMNTAGLACWGSRIVTCDGSIVFPHFIARPMEAGYLEDALQRRRKDGPND